MRGIEKIKQEESELYPPDYKPEPKAKKPKKKHGTNYTPPKKRHRKKS